MGDTGFETLHFSSGNTPLHPKSDAKSDAFAAATAVLVDADNALRRLLAVWPKLSDADRQSLVDRAEVIATGQREAVKAKR